MRGLSWTCVGAVALLLAAHLAADRRGWRRLRAPTKVGASLGFVGLALSLGVEGPVDGFVLAGLVLSLVGDALLLSERRGAFLAGLGVFLVAHLAYATAFWLRGAPPAWMVVPVAAVLGLVLRWLWPHLGGLRVPVVAYAVAIGAMAVLAQGVPQPAVRLGAVLFFASDLFVARERFVRRGPVNRLVGLPLYYAGQVLIALVVG